MKITFLFFLLLGYNFCHSQASWTFDVWFQLIDKENKIITAEHFEKDSIEIFFADYSHTGNTRFTFDEKVNCFKFHQYAVLTPTEIYLVQRNDTLKIRLNTKTLYIGTLKLESKSYDMRVEFNSFNHAWVQWPAYHNRKVEILQGSHERYEISSIPKKELIQVYLMD